MLLAQSYKDPTGFLAKQNQHWFFAAPEQVTNQTKDAAMQTYPTRACTDKNRIFVVDSDVASNEALTRILADESETLVMVDVVAALDSACDRPPVLILLGANIIALEGAGSISRFKKRLPGVKIMIVCDAQDDDKIRQACMLGAESTLQRPLNSEVVRNLVNVLLAPLATRQHALS
jgi:DNA-binding response OmpR family regulator